MTYYAGLDMSLEETAICVVDAEGKIVREVRAASEPDTLLTALKALELPFERIGLEACSLTAWLHDGLRAAGLPAICIEMRQANAAMTEARPATGPRGAAEGCRTRPTGMTPRRWPRSCARAGSGRSM